MKSFHEQIIPPLQGRRKSRDRHQDPREVAVSDHNRQTSHTSALSGQQPRKAHMSRGALWLVLDGEKHPPQAHHGGVCRALDA